MTYLSITLTYYRTEILAAWDNVCRDEIWIQETDDNKNSAEASNAQRSDPSCKNGQSTKDVINRYFEHFFWKNMDWSDRPLSRERPYGQILSAWLLMADAEPEAALRDLTSWDKTFSEERKDDQDSQKTVDTVYRLQALSNIISLYVVRGTARKDELESLIPLFEAKSLIDSLIGNYKNVLKEMKKQSENNETGIAAQCATISADAFKRLYYQRLIFINDLVDILGKYPEVVRALEAGRTLAQYADELVSINIRCLFTIDNRTIELYGTHPIPKELRNDVTPFPLDNEKTSDMWEAFHNSRAVAYRGLAAAMGPSDLTSWANALCKSMRSAQMAHDLAEKQSDFFFLLSSGKLAQQELAEQRGHVEGVQEVSDLDALLREDKALLTQEGEDPSCVGK